MKRLRPSTPRTRVRGSSFARKPRTTPAKKRKTPSLRGLLSVASYVPLDPQGSIVSREPGLWIVARCPNPDCGVRSVWRRADQLAEKIANWPPPDAVLVHPSQIHRKGKRLLVAETGPFEGMCIPHPELVAPPGKVPSVLCCYACGSVLYGYTLDGDKKSARLGW